MFRKFFKKKNISKFQEKSIPHTNKSLFIRNKEYLSNTLDKYIAVVDRHKEELQNDMRFKTISKSNVEIISTNYQSIRDKHIKEKINIMMRNTVHGSDDSILESTSDSNTMERTKKSLGEKIQDQDEKYRISSISRIDDHLSRFAKMSQSDSVLYTNKHYNKYNYSDKYYILKSFINYCVKVHNHENICFYMDVIIYEKTEYAHHDLPFETKKIINQYIYPNPPLEINIDGHTREDIIHSFCSGVYDKNIFSKAVREVYNIMSMDVFNKWMQSREFSCVKDYFDI